MFKNKFHAKAILLTLLSTTTIASAICVASFTTSQQRQLNTDVNSYLINNPNSNKKYLSSYDYESISDYYQQYYVMDVTKEDVKDPIWDSSNSVWLSPHLDKDITYDRFAYLFYPDTTNVCIYQNSGESFNQCDFKDKSIVTNWI